MKAIREPFIQKDRRVVGKLVPLDVPISVVIEPSSACNIRCAFCTFSNPEALKAKKHISKNMTFETLDRILHQIEEFPQKEGGFRLSRIHFVGLGEALCNPDFPEFVRRAKASGVAERVEMVTNGVALSHEMSLAIADSGLDAMVISVNGLDSEDYRKFCNVNVDYDQYYEQIRFLYEHRKQIRIDLKTTDAVADTPEREKLFFDLYGDYCDRINIETIASFHQGAVLEGKSGSLNRHGNVFDPDVAKICPLAFYKLCVFSDGRVNFCDQVMGPVEGLSIYKQTLREIWNSELHQQFMLDLLTADEERVPKMCKGCTTKYVTLGMKEEWIDPYADEVRERIKSKLNV